MKKTLKSIIDAIEIITESINLRDEKNEDVINNILNSLNEMQKQFDLSTKTQKMLLSKLLVTVKHADNNLQIQQTQINKM